MLCRKGTRLQDAHKLHWCLEPCSQQFWGDFRQCGAKQVCSIIFTAEHCPKLHVGLMLLAMLGPAWPSTSMHIIDVLGNHHVGLDSDVTKTECASSNQDCMGVRLTFT